MEIQLIPRYINICVQECRDEYSGVDKTDSDESDVEDQHCYDGFAVVLNIAVV